MTKKLFYFLVILIVPLILYLLSLETIIPMPPDDSHAGLTREAECFECHGEGKEYARKKEHPPKDQCLKCHSPAKT
ncbi:MAG: hypothetical protein JSU90_00050 [Nitrospiraceae bacterium]|nr:MAG: hypothetical protein JSU90_00050 [Nitrospiraceae bacterium]